MVTGPMEWGVAVCLLVLLSVGAATARPVELPRLKVSESGRSLVTQEGSPFFWLADTAWWIRRIAPGVERRWSRCATTFRTARRRSPTPGSAACRRSLLDCGEQSATWG